MENKMERLELAKLSLKGISIGDAFGESFFDVHEKVIERINKRELKLEEWNFTDDTVMGIAIYKILEKYEQINQDELAKLFAENYKKDWRRGYGGTAHEILRAIVEGKPWEDISKSVFSGTGSMGNGSAMRAAPLGAYFYDDLDRIVFEAEKSAKVTHFNIEGIAGAIAIALAAGLMVDIKLNKKSLNPEEFIDIIVTRLPECDLKHKINKVLSVSKTASVDFAASVLGNGRKVVTLDTVPYALWCIIHNYNNFENALWTSVACLGDMDTMCAIVASVVIMYSEIDGIPAKWVENTECIEKSIFWAYEGV